MTTSEPSAVMSAPATSTARRRRSWPFYAGLCVLVAAAATFLVVALHIRGTRASNALRASGIPASVSTSLANVMGLSSVPPRAAPTFQLTDQRGRGYSMSSFRGHAVVLEFMDPHCTDICPLVAQEFLSAYRDLGSNGSKVEFLAVNVNPYHRSRAAVAAFSSRRGLDSIPGWHFLSGPLPSLVRAWRDYGIYVDAPNAKADVIHTSAVYFIDPSGRERYLAVPTDEHTRAGVAFLPPGALNAWGTGIALLASSMEHR